MKTKYIEISEFGNVITGKTPSTKVPEYWNGNIPFITPTDIIGYNMRNIYETERCVSEEGVKKITLLPINTICISCIASIGKICVTTTSSITNQQINSIIVNSNQYYYKYIYYLFRYNLPYLQLIASGTGSGTPIINKEKFKKLKLLVLSDLNIQKKIAYILSKYDDLIENNNKRIKLLEQMAEKMYKNIFSLKKIKNTSKLIRLEEIINITRGLSYSSEEIECEEGIDLINLKNIKSFGGFRLDGTKKYNGKYKEEQVVKTGDLIMGVTDMTQDRRTVGYVALIPILKNLSVISADLIKINSQVDNVYLYCMFRYGQISKYISQFANGANVLHLKPKSVMNIKVYLPRQEKINYFVNIVKPIIQEIDLLNEQISNLIKQRDLLLPRLMSGKLEV